MCKWIKMYSKDTHTPTHTHINTRIGIFPLSEFQRWSRQNSSDSPTQFYGPLFGCEASLTASYSFLYGKHKSQQKRRSKYFDIFTFSCLKSWNDMFDTNPYQRCNEMVAFCTQVNATANKPQLGNVLCKWKMSSKKIWWKICSIKKLSLCRCRLL